MGPNDRDHSSTNDVLLLDNDPGNDFDHRGDAPGTIKGGFDSEGVKEKGMSRWGWEWDRNCHMVRQSRGRVGGLAASRPVRIGKISYNPLNDSPKE
jgi:hypothetical protein